MKKIYLFLVVAVLSFTSCHTDIWNSINDLDSRVKALEELCREMNTNINSLQTLIEVIQSGDYITNIVPITKGGEVIGYTIMFKNHEPITIYNGEDGVTANTPIIGAAQDTDGVYYWTVNGEWLLDDNGNKIRVTGRDGQNGQDGQDGNDGQPGQPGQPGNNGQNGQNGADGITPTLKIENGMWYVSYDNGSTWTMLGQATGDPGQPGQPGQNGQDGESIFANITYDANSVVFTLSDGTTITVPRGNGGTTATVPIIDGAIMAPFSVSDSTQIYFSRGTLLYTNQGSHLCNDGTTKPGTWAFAPNQYMNYTGQIYNGIPVESDSISPTYQGYIMHFQYGTSGYGSTLPYSVTTNYDTSPQDSLLHNHDWGVYNAISNGGNQPNIWRTMTEEEIDYLINRRPGAKRLRFWAVVNDRPGIVLLPDNWSNVSLRYYHNIPSSSILEMFQNRYTIEEWEIFESLGAVLIYDSGRYSSSSITNNYNATHTSYSLSSMVYFFWVNKHRNFWIRGEYDHSECGYSSGDRRYAVRLVKDVPASSNN